MEWIGLAREVNLILACRGHFQAVDVKVFEELWYLLIKVTKIFEEKMERLTIVLTESQSFLNISESSEAGKKQ